MSNTRKRFSKYSNMEKWTGLNKKDVAYIFKLKFKYEAFHDFKEKVPSHTFITR